MSQGWQLKEIILRIKGDKQMKLCDRCRLKDFKEKDEEVIYLESESFGLCKKCISSLLRMETTFMSKSWFYRQQRQEELQAKLRKEIKDLKELVKFMNEH